MNDSKNRKMTPELWSVEEFQNWLKIGLSTRVDHKRATLWAKGLLVGLDIDPDDLVCEATTRILCGTRKLNRAYAMEVNFYGVMKSIAFSWRRRRKRKPEISLEDLMGSDNESTEVLELIELPQDGRMPSAEDQLAYKQEMNELMKLFEDRPDAEVVLLYRSEGLRGADLGVAAGLNTTELATVQRLIARRLASYRRDV